MMSRARLDCLRKRRGFTLVELLTVVAVIAVLVAMLLPAVQSSREAARRVKCLNNLKQLGLALHSHEGAQNAFPQARDEQWWSWTAHVLPYMEENAAHGRIDFSLPAWDAGQNQEVARTVMPILLCASDAGSDQVSRPPAVEEEEEWTFDEAWRSVACGGGEWGYWEDANPFAEFAFTNYPGVSGIQGEMDAEDYAGLGMFPSSGLEEDLGAKLALKHVGDGASKTFFVGERPVARFEEHNGDRYDLGWWATGHGWNPAPYGRADYILDSMDGLHAPATESTAEERATHWWSYHPGGAQFLMVDGSARLIGYDTDHALVLALSTRNGGEVPRSTP